MVLPTELPQNNSSRYEELEKKNKALKEIIIKKELEGKLKDELLKKVCLEKKKLVNSYVFQGLKLFH
jgi:hypothetical protein